MSYEPCYLVISYRPNSVNYYAGNQVQTQIDSNFVCLDTTDRSAVVDRLASLILEETTVENVEGYCDRETFVWVDGVRAREGSQLLYDADQRFLLMCEELEIVAAAARTRKAQEREEDLKQFVALNKKWGF